MGWEEAMQGPDMDIKERFDIILGHVLRHRVVPFVGAGISRNARIDGCPDFEPDLRFLESLLQKRIGEEIKKRASAGQPLSPECELYELHHKNGEKMSFDQVAEIGCSLFGQEEVCRVIRLPDLEKLVPLPAHYALACLALEGLIDEVISTNWDCCIERAMKALTGINARDRCRSICVITDLDSYRRHGARRRTQDGAAVLKLYKINGCAKRLSKGPANGARDIMVTERQLQDFGVRSWARDMLKDRARSRTLVFSGFGSNEPQVRHTVLQLLSEFSFNGSEGEDSTKKADGLADSPAAFPRVVDLPARAEACESEHTLFMITHDKTPSFNQWQVVRGFCEAIGADGPACIEEVRKRVVTGKDAAYFGAIEDSLPADNFWCAVLDGVIYRLLRDRYARRGSVLHSWLALHSDTSDAILDEWLDWLFPPEMAKGSAFRCGVSGLFGPSAGDQVSLSPAGCQEGTPRHLDKDPNAFRLGRWLGAMGWPSSDRVQGGEPGLPLYCPLRTEQLLPLCTLLVLFLLDRIASAWSKSGKGRATLEDLARGLDHSGRSGLRITLPASVNAKEDVLFLVVEDAPDTSKLTAITTGDDKSRVRHEIAIPDRPSAHTDTRLRVHSDGRLRIGRRSRISAAAFVRKASGAGLISLSSLFGQLGGPVARRDRLKRVEPNK
jgi:hypothetical protein